MRLAALALALVLAAAPAYADEPPRQITVTGSAEAEAVPDLATITAGVETRAGTAAEALARNSEAMSAVLAAIEAGGVARRDVQTSQLSISPVYEPYSEGAPEARKVAATVPVALSTPGNAESADVLDAMTAVTPAGRPVRPVDVAFAVRYLVSAEAAFVHGTLLDVDGGILHARLA